MTGQKLMDMFRLMLEHFGHQNWWPADTAFEVMVGAILTQNTNWKNVEKAIANLTEKKLLDLNALHHVPAEILAKEIRPAGYYNLKAVRLKNLVDFVMDRYNGNLDECLADETEDLRKGLLSVKGIGPETADSILLYAAKRPVFVIDAYTHRIMSRHHMFPEEGTYDELQNLFMYHLPDDHKLFNEFHALIVQTGKTYCKKRPVCEGCPLKNWTDIRP